MHKVLIIEDKESMARMLKEAIEAEGYNAITAPDGAKGIEILRGEPIELVLTDLNLPQKSGLDVLKASKELNPLRPVIVMTAYGSIETAVDAMKEGAADFITKPFNIDHLLMLIGRALKTRKLLTENLIMRAELTDRIGFPVIVGKSKAIQDVADTIKRVAPTKTTILLLGRSGTGKELFARAIHFLSDRGDAPFVTVNCAAIPKDLLESELFGHEKGAFTGADSRKAGKFELADGGTIFLDEIAEMDKSLQAKLLRALQENEIDRVGSTKPVKVDVRVIAASNKDIAKAVEDGEFRDDLYYRINVFPITVPLLKDRIEDVPMLASFFVEKHCSDIKKSIKGISDDAISMLMSNEWKGNVRELENTIERAVILCDGDTILPEHLALAPGAAVPSAGAVELGKSLDVKSKEASRKAETAMIREALKATGGNKTKAAAILDVSYKTLLTKIKDYEIE